ncbi:D-alanine---D-serine ligase [Breznakia blatticola]|uniref:D-alanine--D-alanine ligase n=1 Tax=Breznakia blatticola TaxID=1754012 RepID=A0A4R7ZFR3_9FIRM|nr:D-alanine--D-alanine ligase family protein [Breznakia blatticola]TDW12644.1 D-alanine---D-serine ligase [Breznakia blatticola]
MSKLQVGVIFGGNSSEYPVSLHSVASVLRNLDANKYDVTMIGIDPNGNWYVYDGDIDTLEHDHWLESGHATRALLSPSKQEGLLILENGTYTTKKLDVLLPILHGKNGEDGTIQGLFTLSQIPYVGCNHVSSAIAMDKEYTHIICESAGIPMAPYIALRKNMPQTMAQIVKQVEAKLQFPLFVKPANAGSSFGISKVNVMDDLEKAIDFAYAYDDKIVIESGISGFEVGSSVLGNDALIIGDVDEIETHNSFFDYDAKYELENTQIHCPARISDEKKAEIKAYAKTIYHVLGCSGLSRIDMFIDDDEKIFFNEINTIPGFTSASRYPSMMANVGYDFPKLLDTLLELALEKANATK